MLTAAPTAGVGAGASLLSGRRSAGDGLLPGVDAALAKATAAAKLAWKLEEGVKSESEANQKYAPLMKAEVAVAKTAAEAAGEADDKATALLAETRAGVNKAAMAAAEAYYEEVRKAGADATAAASPPAPAPAPASVPAGAAGGARAADAAAEAAAKPYRALLLRGEQAVADYQHRAEALAIKSSNLQGQALAFAGTAKQYQAAGQTAEAKKAMITARLLLEQGKQLRSEAEQLHATAVVFNSGLPVYHLAEQAAADAAVVEAEEVLPLPPAPPRMLPY